MRRWLCTLICLCLLTTSAGAWTDGEGHWAEAELNRAVERGWVSGYEDGTLRPDDRLTWGHYLTMLGRAFWPEEVVDQPPDARSHWAEPYRQAAEAMGVAADGGELDEPLTRQGAAGLLYAVLHRVSGVPDVESERVLTDWETLPEAFRPAVAQLAQRGIVRGYEDGTFHGERLLSRAEGVVFLDRLWNVLEEQVGVMDLPEEAPPPAEEPPEDPELRTLGENAAKLERLYGTADRRRYDSEAEAESHMAEVTVPVWKLDGATGEKTPGELTFTVHEAIVSDMEAIFTEIFQDPEQFPIYEIGGYDWRGDSAKGEHNCGTAMDINANENYQVYAGGVGAGDHWTPGEDPYSIPEDGSVVRIFQKYGYSWGGNAWPTNKDYMHFSYLGV